MTGALRTSEKGLVVAMFKGNKFNANMDKHHRSAKERARAAELRLMERAGIISLLQEQVKYELIPKQNGERAVFYVADFVYWKDGRMIVEDVKGYRKGTAYELYVIKRKLMLYRYGIHITET